MALLRFLYIIVFVSLVCVVGNAETIKLVALANYAQAAAYKEVVEFVSAVIKDAGYDVAVVEIPRKRGAFSVNSGEYDAIPIRGLDDAHELPNVIVTSFPIAFTNFRVISLKENKKFSESKLKQFSGAIVLNNSSLRSEIEDRNLHVNEVNAGYADLTKMLTSRRVDYIIMPEEIFASIVDVDKGLRNSLKLSGRVFVRTPLYFSMHKKHQAKMSRIEASFRKALKSDTSHYKYIHGSLNSKLDAK